MSTTPDMIAGYIIVGLFLLWFIGFQIVRRKQIWQAVIGEDGKPQMVEILVYIALILFVLVVVLDAGFGRKASEHIVYCIDGYLMLATAAKVTNDHLQIKRNIEKPNSHGQQ